MRIDVNAKDDRGATAIEYALIIAGVAMALIVAVTLLGGNIAQAFTGAGNALSGQAADQGTNSGQAPTDTPSPSDSPAAPTPYAGQTPSSSYSQNLGNGGSFTLPSIPGVTYSIIRCSNSVSDGCDRDKTSFNGQTFRVDPEWSKEHRAATFTVSWLVPATATTDAGTGTFSVTLR